MGTSITSVRLGQEARIDALPRHFGAHLMLAVEQAVFQAMEELVADYRGGYWHFYDLSNGGFYMAPDLQPLRLYVPGNDFCDVLSADAAGIVACLFAYGRLYSTFRSDVLAEHYHRLRDFALSHREAQQILRAID